MSNEEIGQVIGALLWVAFLAFLLKYGFSLNWPQAVIGAYLFDLVTTSIRKR
jgi:hypothetical protein